ncbi:hypothetical protein [Actinomadura atramentaria]|uniref:hypothetical protein n=1 Tax=Actinomadura atramentaria TaxID=1990 RepID=UPI00036D56B2|nr:hypothetical protein [Actinomadura atramentaria]
MTKADPADIELPHGYRLTQIDRFARVAALHSRFRHIQVDEAVAIARSAMLEALYGSDAPPEPDTRLLDIGRYAIMVHIREAGRMYGLNLTRTDRPRVMRNHVRYWHTFTAGTSSPEDTVIDTTALHQILATLHPDARQILETLAIHDTNPTTAAAALGLTRGAFAGRLWRARREFYRLWHEGETPTNLWRATRHRPTPEPTTTPDNDN